MCVFRVCGQDGGGRNDIVVQSACASSEKENSKDESNVQCKLDDDLIYLQAQRWGSGVPIDPETVATPSDVEEICGIVCFETPQVSGLFFFCGHPGSRFCCRRRARTILWRRFFFS